MKWTTDQQDRITEAALVACPALDALTPEQVAAWVDRAEATGVDFDGAVAWLTDAALSHRKGQNRPQPGDVLQAFRTIAVQSRSVAGPVSGGGGRLSADAANDLPRICERFVRLAKVSEHYGQAIGYAGDAPWPPALVVESAYRECIARGGRRIKTTRAPRAVETPTRIVESAALVYEWDRPWCNAVICERVGEWYAKQGVA